jgi:multimeric flavodoxin WrbA
MAKKYRPLESVESIAGYDAVIVGSSERDGTMSAELKGVLDQAEALAARGALRDKVGSAFGAASDKGLETNVVTVLLPLMRLGMILVPPDYDDARSQAGGGDALSAARRQGARVAKVAEWVRHAKSHEAHAHKH